MNLREGFARTVRCYPNKPALVTTDGRTLTYDEFDTRSTRLANALRDRVGAGRCAVLSLNGIAAVESMIAGNKRGVGTVQLPYRATTDELDQMARTAEAEVLIFDDANADTAQTLLDRGTFEAALHRGEREPDHDAVASYEDVLASAAATPLPERSVGEECGVFYSSGSTSTPKAVKFNQEQLWYGAIQGVMEHGIDETDVALCTTPWYHMVTTDAWLYPHFLSGATVVLHSSFDPAAALSLIAAHDVTGLLAVPTQLEALNSVQREEDYDVESLSYVRTAGAPITEELVAETRSILCEHLYNSYGMTEAGPDLTFAHPTAQVDHPGTVGKESFSWEVRVVETAALDEDPDPEATVNAGERGELIARGPGMSEGYIDNPAAEAKSYFDGWLRTRDVVTVDEDGYLYIVDRVDNMIITGGENVYPVEVERTLERHPAVDEACVVGLDDDQWGQLVAAVVVGNAELSADEIDVFCREHSSLADFKRPRKYAIRKESIPRTDTGTPIRSALRAEHFPGH